MTTTFTTLYSKRPYQGYEGPLLTLATVKVLMLMDTTDTFRLPRSMVHPSTARVLNTHGLLKNWYLYQENVEKHDTLTYKKSDLDKVIPHKAGERLVNTWELSDKGQRVADTIQHLRHLRRVMASFNMVRYGRAEHASLADEQWNSLHWLYQSIEALDPHDLTKEPVGALADRVQQEIAETTKKAATA